MPEDFEKSRAKNVSNTGVTPFCISFCSIFHCEKVTPHSWEFLDPFFIKYFSITHCGLGWSWPKGGVTPWRTLRHNTPQPPIEGKHLTPKVVPPFDPAFGVQNLTPRLGQKGCVNFYLPSPPDPPPACCCPLSRGVRGKTGIGAHGVMERGKIGAGARSA